MERKKCGRCGIEKDINDFSFKNTKKGTRQSSCRECFKTLRKVSYNKNKKHYIEKAIKNKNLKSKWLQEYKSKLKCTRCGENHIATLQFHHINPNEKEKTVASLVSGYSIETIMKEINKCEVLCANCHAKHHYEEKQNASIV